MIEKFCVGYEFSLFKDHPKKDGAVLEVSKEGSYILPIFLSGMLPKEIEAIRRGKIEFRVFEDNGTGFLLTLIRLGMNSLTFEIIFDPTLYKDRKNDISLYTKSNVLHISGVEATNNILQCQRLISIPPELQAKWLNSWEKMLSMGDCNKQYMDWIFSLYRFDLKTLWSYSTCVAKIPGRNSL
jgi:hypothetical protein